MKIKRYCKIRYLNDNVKAIVGIIIATFFWISFFSNRMAPKVLSLAKIEADSRLYNVVNEAVRKGTKNMDVSDFLIFKKNDENELILAKYDLKNVYKILDRITFYLKMNGDFVFFLPSAFGSKSFLVNYFGTKIPIRVKLSQNVYTNIKTKITNYGLNNALAEIYVIINVNQAIISPFDKSNNKQKYEILISTNFIVGKVPSYYGNNYEISSNIFDIRQKI